MLGATIRAENDQTVEMMFRPKEEERIFDRLVAEQLAAAATGRRGPIQVKTEPKKEEPPKLFELTELQKTNLARLTIVLHNPLYDWSKGDA